MPRRKSTRRLQGVWGAVRFVGAFHRGYPLRMALRYDLGSSCPERAAAALRGDTAELKVLSSIAMVFRPADIRRVFSGDCWSIQQRDGDQLVPTRNYRGGRPTHHGYEEGFLVAGCRPVAILVIADRILEHNRSGIMRELRARAAEAGIPLFTTSSEGLVDDAAKLLRRERRGTL